MTIVYILLGVIAVLIIANIIVSLKNKPKDNDSKLAEIKNAVDNSSNLQREVMNTRFDAVSASITDMKATVSDQITQGRMSNDRVLDTVLDGTTKMHEQNAENIRAFHETLSREMQTVRTDMQSKLDEIKNTVDEQLQTNLEKKLQESFRTVSEQLLAVQRGLGEMQSLASNVGDLKKTLSNVKTRGIWGEIQLGSILGDILSPSQYDTNVITVPNTINRVEYAIKLPGSGNDTVYLPIDSKFPGDTYNKLLEAYDSANSVAVEAAWKDLDKVLCSEAKDIHDKYIHLPETTEFGIMFLPVEGLYAEAVRHGMVEKLQNLYKINIAGPTTMAALLNSLQMGFKTLQIQKQSGEVWKILQSTRVEFEKYADVLTKAQANLKKTQEDLETLVGVRTRQVVSKLSKIEQYNPDVPEIEG